MEVSLIGTGSYLPNCPISNEQLVQFPSNALPLIKLKTGVEARYHVSVGQHTSDIAVAACKNCLEKTAFDPSSIDALICATSTPDRLIPATATKIANAIGAANAFAFDVNSVCSGGLIAVVIGRGLILSGAASNVMVVAADTYSRILDPLGFSTMPYFGDGAGSLLLSSSGGFGKIGNGVFHSDGSGYNVITVKAGASEIPAHKLEDKRDAYFTMDGRSVFEFATSKVPAVIEELFAENSISKDDVAQVILHQANVNIIDKIAIDLGIDRNLFFVNLNKCGNTACASVIIALDEYCSLATMPKKGKIILSSFGGGLTWGALAIDLNG